MGKMIELDLVSATLEQVIEGKNKNTKKLADRFVSLANWLENQDISFFDYETINSIVTKYSERLNKSLHSNKFRENTYPENRYDLMRRNIESIENLRGRLSRYVSGNKQLNRQVKDLMFETSVRPYRLNDEEFGNFKGKFLDNTGSYNATNVTEKITKFTKFLADERLKDDFPPIKEQIYNQIEPVLKNIILGNGMYKKLDSRFEAINYYFSIYPDMDLKTANFLRNYVTEYQSKYTKRMMKLGDYQQNNTITDKQKKEMEGCGYKLTLLEQLKSTLDGKVKGYLDNSAKAHVAKEYSGTKADIEGYEGNTDAESGTIMPNSAITASAQEPEYAKKYVRKRKKHGEKPSWWQKLKWKLSLEEKPYTPEKTDNYWINKREIDIIPIQSPIKPLNKYENWDTKYIPPAFREK